jgi:hypothetical protein
MTVEDVPSTPREESSNADAVAAAASARAGTRADRASAIANGAGILVSALAAVATLIWMVTTDLGGSPLALLAVTIAAAVAYRLTFALVNQVYTR